jgi:hypothetical protein
MNFDFNKKNWISFKFFDNKYSLSEDGELYSYFYNRKIKPISPQKSAKSKQYFYVFKDKKRKKMVYVSVGKLMLTFFKEIGAPKQTVLYKDGNFKNHRIENLKWISYSEYMKYYKKPKYISTFMGKKLPNCKYMFNVKIGTINIRKYFKYYKDAIKFKNDYLKLINKGA